MSRTGAAPRQLETSWDTAVLVCGACRKRGSGPKKSKAAAIVDALRAGLKGIRPRVVVTTGCLGPCPKKAITVALPGAAGTPARVWAIASAGEAAFVGERLGESFVEPPDPGQTP